MAALTRPMFDTNDNMMFVGKISIWPFTEIVKVNNVINK